LKRITKLIKWLQSENVPIHGIGIQAHWTLDSPSLADIENAINTYAALGLQVQITELDVVMNPDFKGSEEEKINLLASRYAEIFEVFRKNRNKLSGITFWQTEDMPATYPPLFDAVLKPTKIYQAVLNAWSAN
jgi:endo-1,4-beta-xylanase